MRTEDLIEHLSARLGRTTRHAAARRVGLGLLAGAVAAAPLLVLWIGLRSGLAQGAPATDLVAKLAYAGSTALIAALLACRLGRPEGRLQGREWLLLSLPFLALAVIAAAQLASAPSEAARLQLWLGHSWADCVLRVVVLSAPAFAGVLWAFRRLAPTRLHAAGGLAGLSAGATGAFVYAFACPEPGAAFVATWYTAGMLATAGSGAALGPRLLRW